MSEKKYTPCDGCGAQTPKERCIGCFHPFTKEEEIEQENRRKTQQFVGSYYQPLFDLLHQKHGLTPLESEMADIIHVVERMQGKQQGAVWVKGINGFPIMKRVVAKFKHYDDPKRDWVVGYASSSTGELITFDWYVSSITLKINDERWQMFEWLDESRVVARSNESILTQSRADFIREVNDMDMDGLEVIEFAEWFWGYCKEYRRSGTYVTNFNEVMTVKELYKLFKQQKEK